MVIVITWVAIPVCNLRKLELHPLLSIIYTNSSELVLDRIAQLDCDRPIFYKGNVCDCELLKCIFSEHCINSVIHFAGLKLVGESVSQPLNYFEHNVYESLVLAPDHSLQSQVCTNKPALQLYIGNFLQGTLGRGQTTYNNNSGITLETHFLPDSPNHLNWPQGF